MGSKLNISIYLDSRLVIFVYPSKKESYMKQFECEAVLFDLDGVLVDSTLCVERHWRCWAKQHGLDISQILKISHGRPTIETMRLVAPYLSIEGESKNLDQLQAVDTADVVEVTGAANLLKKIPSGKWAVVTSGNYAIAINRMSHIGLPLPQVLVTSDNVKHGKPHPEGYLKAANLLGVEPYKCVVIEDSPPGIQAAKAASMKVIGVTTTYQASKLLDTDICVQNLADLEFHKLDRLENDRTYLRLLVLDR